MKSRDLLEKVNDATVTPGFYAEKPIMGGRYIIKARAKEIEGMSPALLVSVHDPRNPHRGSGFLEREGMGGIASFRFIARPDGSMYSSSSGVDPRYQRQGIATEVYRFVRSLGNSIKPSSLQTDQGRAMWQAWQDRGIMETAQGVQLRGLGRFFQGRDLMAELVPERGTHSYALHPSNWERTFYSLTLKDPHKIRFYRPRDIDLPPGTLVADMFWANRFHRAKTDAERQHAVEQYRRSMVPVNQADISKYRMPELLIPPALDEEPAQDNKKQRDVFTAQDKQVLANFFRDRKYLQYRDHRYLIYDENGLTFQAHDLDDAERYARAIARRGLDQTVVVVDRDTKFPVVIFRGAEDMWLQTDPSSPRLNEWDKRTIIWSRDNPPPMQELFRRLIELVKDNDNTLTMQQLVDQFNEAYGLHYTLRDYKKFSMNNQYSQAAYSDAVGHAIRRGLFERWSKRYKKSINCNDPKGFSQKAHCAARRARQAGRKTKSSSITESQGQPRVYLDMDGVLADFFTEWAKLAGVESGSYRDIPPARVDPTLDKMVGTDFFRRLPKFATTDALIRMIVKNFGGYSICSSPLRGDHENSAKNKRLWIQQNLDPQPQAMEFTGRKEQHARQPDGTPNILIDDRGSNITKWEEAGGIGIKYQADEDGLDVIQKGLARADRIISGQEKLEPQKLQSRDRSQIMSTGDDLTPDSIHDLADQRGVAWDNDAKFMAQSQLLTGKRHLDDMTPMELARIRAWLKGLTPKKAGS